MSDMLMNEIGSATPPLGFYSAPHGIPINTPPYNLYARKEPIDESGRYWIVSKFTTYAASRLEAEGWINDPSSS
jgi:hypothetical protein